MKIQDIEDAIEIVKTSYDPKKRRFKNLIVPVIVMVAIVSVFFLVGFLFNVPTILLLTMFSLSISLLSIIQNHWVVNSVVIPMWITYGIIAFKDAFWGEWASCIIHGINATIGFIISFRKDTSLTVMIGATFFYTAWVASVNKWIPYWYNCTSWFCDPVFEATGLLISGLCVSIGITLIQYYKLRKGKIKIDCEGGICPL